MSTLNVCYKIVLGSGVHAEIILNSEIFNTNHNFDVIFGFFDKVYLSMQNEKSLDLVVR